MGDDDNDDASRRDRHDLLRFRDRRTLRRAFVEEAEDEEDENEESSKSKV